MHPSSSSFHLYYSHCLPLDDQQHITHEPFHQQQPPFSNDNNYHTSLIVSHENTSNTTTIQSSNNKGKFVAKSHVDTGKNCFTNKRSSKKDRHSKINTLQGPRDRRMRLSLDVAKKFFRLQDMLGFDKASDTIEWLIIQSKPAIRDLLTQHLNKSCSLMDVSNNESSASECEVMSGIIDTQSTETVEDPEVIINKEKKKKNRLKKNMYIDQSLAKETREKARERARKRTTEKRYIKLSSSGAGCDQYSKIRSSLDQVIDQNTNRLGSWTPFGEGQAQTTNPAEYTRSHFQFKQGIVNNNPSIMSSHWNPTFFNYQHNPGLSHEHQFSDFQILGKPWEDISN